MKREMAEASMKERVDKLRSVPLFAGLSEASLERILDHATEFEAAPGHVLVQPNQPGSGLFVIEEGTVTVELRDKKLELGEGEFFGELALLDDSVVHTGRVCAASPLKGLAINRDDFAELLETEPTIGQSMLRVLAKRLAQTSTR
jgi:voltage-gated potassium channel